MPLLVAVVVIGVASIPWQQRQWRELERAREAAARQENRLQAIKDRAGEIRRIDDRLATDPKGLETRLEAARSFLSRGESARAAKLLQEIERESGADPALAKDAALAAALSSLYERIGWQDRALILAEKARSLEPESVDALIRVAFLEALLGWQKDCQSHVKEAVRRAPESAEPHLAQALVLDQVGGLPDAEKELRTADRLRPGDWRIRLLLSRNLMAQKRFAEALEILLQATAAEQDAAILAAIADCRLQRLEASNQRDPAELETALADANRYLEAAPNSPEARFLLGKAKQLKGDTEGALSLWNETYRLQPDFGKLRITLGTLLARTGDRARGRTLLDEARRDQDISNEYHRLVTAAGQRRDEPGIHRELARHCMRHNRIPRAIIEWSEVLRVAPGDQEATDGIAAAKRIRGDLPTAP
ncbi:MAG: tetratricopeptide repeat protein [Armatimonadota bacterium]